MADALKVEIDVTQARTALQGLGTEITKLGSSLSGLAASGTKEFGKIAQATALIKPVDASVVASLTNLAGAAQKLGDMSNLKNFVSEVKKLSTLAPEKVTTAFNNLERALSALKVPAGLNNLPSALSAVTAAASRTTSAANQSATAINKHGTAAQNATGSTKNMATSTNALAGALQALGAVFAGISIGSFVKGAYEAVTAMDRFNNTVKAVTGSSAAVGDEFEFINKLADSSATSIGTLTDSYGKFSAAARLSGATLEQTHKIFEAVTNASRVLKLSGDDLKYSFLALEQMFSKGKVSSEELRRQFGERFPGSFAIAAKAIGVTTAELDKMLKKGEVISKDFLPKFADELNKTFGQGLVTALQSAQAAFTSFGNGITRIQQAFGRGFFDAFKAEISDLAKTLNNETTLKNFAAIGEAVGAGVSLMVRALKGAVDVFNTFGLAVRATQSILEAVVSVFNSVAGVITPVTDKTALLNVALRALGAAITIIAVPTFGLWLANVALNMAGWGKALDGVNASMLKLLKNPMTWFVVALAAAIATVVGMYIDWTNAQDQLNKATEPTAKQLADTSATLKTLREDMANLATETGKSAEEASQFADDMVKAAASPSDMTAALEKNIETQKKFVANLEKARDALIERMRVAMLAAMADNKIDEQERQRIAMINELLGRVNAQTEAEKQQLQMQELKAGAAKIEVESLKSVSAEMKNNAGATVTAASGAKDVAEAYKNTAGSTKSFADRLRDLWTATNSGVDSLFKSGSASETLGDAVKNAGEKAKGAGDNIKGAADKVGELAPAADKAKTSTASLGFSVGGVINGLLGISPAAAETTTGFNNIATSAGTVTPPVEAAGTAAGNAGSMLNEMGEKAATTGVSVEELANKATGLGDKTATPIQKITELVTNLLKLRDALGATGQSLATAGQAFITYQGQLAPVNTVLWQLANAHNQIAMSLGPIMSQMPMVATAVQTLGTNAGVANPMMATMSTTLAAVSTTLTTMSTAIPIVSQGFTLLGTAMTTIAAVITTVNTGFNALLTSVQSVNQLDAAITKLSESATSSATAASTMATNFARLNTGTSAAVKGINALNTGLSANIKKMEETGAAVDKLIAKYNALAEAATKAMNAANAANAAGGGGPGGESQQRRYGGFSDGPATGRPISTTAADFSGAPTLANGISNTNKLLRKMGGGGIPTILHPNEAVVPLPKGRSIPVDLNMGFDNAPKVASDQSSDAGAPAASAAMASNMMRGLSGLTDAIDGLSSSIAGIPAAAPMAVPMRQPKLDIDLSDLPQQRTPARTNSQTRNDDADANPVTTDDSKPAREVQASGPTIIKIDIHAADYDSFKRSEDQLARDLGSKITKATRRIGGR